VVSFGKQMGVTFPLLMQGYQTSQAYGAQKNYIYLVDKNGVVQAIAMLPATTVNYSQIDSVVKAIADKIPALLNAAVRHWKALASLSQVSIMILDAPRYDVRGRLVGASHTITAFQQILVRNSAVKTHPEKVLFIK
jgi:hypothetical protein